MKKLQSRSLLPWSRQQRPIDIFRFVKWLLLAYLRKRYYVGGKKKSGVIMLADELGYKLEQVTVVRKLWVWLKDAVDDRDYEAVCKILGLMERVQRI